MAPLRILVVEDDAVIGTLLAEILEAMGHTVCAIATTEADAVTEAARRRPELMIVDFWLGDGSGVSAVETICRNETVPHIFVTGDASRITAARPGVAVLQKPYREIELARAIEQAIRPALPAQ